MTPRRFMNELTGSPLALVFAEQADNLLLMEIGCAASAAFLLGCLSSCSNPMARNPGSRPTLAGELSQKGPSLSQIRPIARGVQPRI